MGLRELSIDADILVIGGGTAGVMAAIRAKTVAPSKKVVVFDKSDILYSGSIARGMDALNVVAVPGMGTPEEYIETAQLALDQIVDDTVCYAWVSRTWELVKKLEEWGMCFPKDRHGNYQVLDVPPKGKFCLAIKEPNLKVKLAQITQNLGVQVFNRTMALELLVSDNQVHGAVGFNVRTGSLIICKAKSVIISCGGTARFGETTNGYPYGTFDFPGNTGEAYAMAFKAGANLTGFEYTIVDYSVKDINAAGLHISQTRGATLVDAFDQPVSENQLSISNLVKLHEAGRGPLRVQMQHLPEEKILEIEDILFTTERPIQERFFKGRNINFRTHDIEQWTSECFLCGGHGITGIMVNQKAETSIRGLYAAGDAANVRGFLPGALIMGEIAAENALDYLASCPAKTITDRQLDPIKEKVIKAGGLQGPVSIQEFEQKLRRTITNYITPPKNAYKLGRALEWMDRFKDELYQVVGVREVSDVYKVFEIESIITSAVLSAVASNERKESRWDFFHYRTDYPQKDDANWVKHVVLQKGADESDVVVSFKPVERMALTHG